MTRNCFLRNLTDNMPTVIGFFCLLFGAAYDAICSLLSFITPGKLKPIRHFTDDVVLVTGAAHGVGRCLSIDFARRGGTLVLWDINEAGLESVRREIERDFPAVEVFTYVCNLAHKGEVYSTAEKVKQEVGNVSVLVNNAGIVSGKSFLDETDEELERSTTINYMAHTWVSASGMTFDVRIVYLAVKRECSFVVVARGVRALETKVYGC